MGFASIEPSLKDFSEYFNSGFDFCIGGPGSGGTICLGSPCVVCLNIRHSFGVNKEPNQDPFGIFFSLLLLRGAANDSSGAEVVEIEERSENRPKLQIEDVVRGDGSNDCGQETTAEGAPENCQLVARDFSASFADVDAIVVFMLNSSSFNGISRISGCCSIIRIKIPLT